MTDKTAVDDPAKEYWVDYFKDYGEQLTKEVPRKISEAVGKAGRIIPTASAPTEDGGMVLEGVFNAPDEKVAFSARFRKDGTLSSFDKTTV